jgi:hypothetical protein
MANTSATYVDLDFDTAKASLKQFLKGNAIFKDYDFEGSNLNILLDLLAFNTHKNAFYTNMALSEAFLDSAQTRSSIASHAKDLNYLPVSFRSSKARVSTTFTASGLSQPYIIEKGSSFSTIVKSQTYTFSIPETVTVGSSNTTFTFETDIYEGYYVKDTYIYLETEDVQTFKITNRTVDTSSLTVAVYEDDSVVPTIFKRADTLLGLTDQSEVFFLQPTGNGYYEIVFGDNIFGRKPKAYSQLVLDYRISAGSASNGAKSFAINFDPTGSGELTSISSVTTIDIAANGGENQTVDSIKLYAPRYFASQQRAVANDDYSSLVLSNFSTTISDCAIYGGETLEPKQYGRVVIALKPVTGSIAPDIVKQQVEEYLLKYVSLPTRVIISDPENFYCKINSTVQYDTALATKTQSEIENAVLNTILQYSSDNLEKFNGDFRYSKFVKQIDDADGSITSNDTNVWMIKKLQPATFTFNTFEIEFGNTPHEFLANRPVLTTSAFTYVDPNDESTEYALSYIENDTTGKLSVYTYINNVKTVLNSNIGTLDSSTGKAVINKMMVGFYGTSLNVYLELSAKDVVINKSSILTIDLEDIDVSAIGTNR